MDNNLQEISLSEVKTIELEILKSFDSFCNKNNLRYFLALGTLIGAIRHKGFIPWDDDIDVYMPRPDYMQFLKLAENSADLHYKVINPYKSPGYIHTYAKIFDPATLLIEYPETLRFEIGVYIDVFPVDGVPSTIKESDALFKKMRKLITMNWMFMAQCDIYKLDKRLHVRAVGYLVSLIASITGKKFYFKKLDSTARKYEFDKCEYSGVTAAGYGRTERIKRSLFTNIMKVEFENHLFNAPAGYHEYLTNIYGNYMELPPPEQRTKRHNNEVYRLSDK